MNYSIDIHKLGPIEIYDLYSELEKFNPSSLIIDILEKYIYMVVFVDDDVYSQIDTFLNEFTDVSYFKDTEEED